ncbi:MAG: hypothetical protein HFJ41_02605 [Clostridia bacterium]|nr:hypothetical protein [Clostridia bacterium]
MKKKLVKKAVSFLLIFSIFCLNGNIVFAKELVSENQELIQEDISISNGSISTMNSADAGIVPVRGYIDLYPELDSYIGFNKKITVNATTDSESTFIYLYLYDPNGNLKSNDWIMGSNEIAQWSLFLPSSGTWRLRVISHASTTPVRVFVQWE